MSFGIAITYIKQLLPITATSATVEIGFTMTGIQPDQVQVYAFNAAETGSKGLGDVMDTVDLNVQYNQYNSQIQVQAGAYYTIALCPRNKTGDTLDDQIDGQYWEAYCVYASFVTQATSQPQGQANHPAPVITALAPQSATLYQDGNIAVQWQSSITYQKFLIWWTEDGIANQQGESDLQGTSGSWTASPAMPGHYYSFAVKGGVARAWGDYDYSDWGPTLKLVAPPNGTQLRKFLLSSGIDPTRQGMRSLMSGQTSLRKFMKLA